LGSVGVAGLVGVALGADGIAGWLGMSWYVGVGHGAGVYRGGKNLSVALLEATVPKHRLNPSAAANSSLFRRVIGRFLSIFLGLSPTTGPRRRQGFWSS
jgi:hypothetical protein